MGFGPRAFAGDGVDRRAGPKRLTHRRVGLVRVRVGADQFAAVSIEDGDIGAGPAQRARRGQQSGITGREGGRRQRREAGDLAADRIRELGAGGVAQAMVERREERDGGHRERERTDQREDGDDALAEAEAHDQPMR